MPPLPPPLVPEPLAAPEFGVQAELAAQGMANFEQTCSACHGGGAVSAGMAPDLRAFGVVLSETGFADVVRGGARVGKGMPAHTDLTDQELLALRHYIRMHAEAAIGAKRQ